jgi:acetyl-CoA acetyltransferase family protein
MAGGWGADPNTRFEKEVLSMEIKELVLLDGVRTPMGEFNRSFAEISAIDLGAHAARALFERTGLEPEVVDHAVVGNALQTSPDAIYGARHVALKAGVPVGVPAMTVNRLCGSGIQSIISGAHLILNGEASTCLVGGMENMSQAPHCIWGARRGFALGEGKLEDLLMVALLDSYCGCYMAQTSNNLAREYGITRQEQDEFAVESQRRASAAWDSGRLAEEVVAVQTGKGRRPVLVERDEHLRPDTNLEGLEKLPPVFEKEGFVTAGNASGIVDGAAMLLLTTAERARAWDKEPLGRILAWSVVGVDPEQMGIGPAPAIRQAGKAAGLEISDFDLVEINEAFAGQILAVIRELDLEVEKLNVNGGAVALGHPLGATGSRIVLTLLKELRRRGGGVGVASACIGGGQGIAMVVEVDG